MWSGLSFFAVYALLKIYLLLERKNLSYVLILLVFEFHYHPYKIQLRLIRLNLLCIQKKRSLIIIITWRPSLSRVTLAVLLPAIQTSGNDYMAILLPLAFCFFFFFDFIYVNNVVIVNRPLSVIAQFDEHTRNIIMQFLRYMGD